MNYRNLVLCMALLGLSLPKGWTQENLAYQMPPKSIADLVDTPMPPTLEINNNQTWMLVLKTPRYVDMELAANPMVGLAGLRINPNTFTLEAELHGFFTDVEVTNLANNSVVGKIQNMPVDYKISNIQWHPNGNGFAFTNRVERGLELWYADLTTMQAKKLSSARLNALTGKLMEWSPTGEYILVQVPANDGKALPVKNRIPHGPVIQENLGTKAPTRTFSYLLTNSYDEQLFEYYTTSQLTKVYLDGRSVPTGKPAIFKSSSFSTDGSHILVETVEKPYSYMVTMNSFPSAMEVWNAEGQMVKQITAAGDTSRNRGRMYRWRKDKPAELYFVKNLPADQRTETEREGVFSISAPFTGEEKLIVKTSSFGDIIWGNDQYAILRESNRQQRKSKLTLFNPTSGETIKVIDERSTEDNYSDPGTFVMKNDVLMITGRRDPIVHTIGNGASDLGERPFLLRWDLMKDKRDTLFKSATTSYERPVAYAGGDDVYITRETWNIPANLIQYNLKRKRENPITNFGPAYPTLEGVEKTMITYKRKDGVVLNSYMYLPAGFEPGKDAPLPVMVWAYPREFKTREAASQVKGSPHKFTEINFRSAVYWVTRGYAIVDLADMPIIGEGKEEPNDTFVEQIIMNSEALIDYMAERGIGDRDRFGVGGHSYGAFMTANLLAHSDLFAAGIARSGAYNRTLTPFGFQSEQRNYWQAKELYDRMSPFTYADKIKTPLLITHGIDDENSGTFPVQSERLYAAIKGNGGTVRLVMFPHEFHGFRARESIMHVMWEKDQWLEKYVKNRVKKEEK